MELLFLVIGGGLAIYAVLNLAFNGRTKFWEVFTIAPINLLLFLTFIGMLLSFTFGYYVSFPLYIIGLVSLFPWWDISYGKPKSIVSNNGKKTLKVIDYNTLYFYPDNYQELAQFLSQKNADFIIIQELFTAPNLATVHKMGDGIPTQITEPQGYISQDEVKDFFPTYPYVLTALDKGVISKFPLEKIKEVEAKSIFGYFICKSLINHTELYIINVHMPFRMDLFFGFDEKKICYQELYDDIYELKKQGKQILLTGDFNQTKNSRFIQKLFDMLHETISESNTGVNISWHIHKLPLWRLDFMFYTQSNTFKLIKSSLFKEKYSDHKGIESVFIVKDSA